MKISIRFEGGIGDHILANRFTQPIIDKYSPTEINLYSDTNKNPIQSEIINYLFDYYNTTHLVSKKSHSYEARSQFGVENYPGHIDNISDQDRALMLNCDLFLDMHIDSLRWLKHKTGWQKYFFTFPEPTTILTDEPNNSIIFHLASDNLSNNHRMSAEYINNLLDTTPQQYNKIILCTPSTQQFIKDVTRTRKQDYEIYNKDIKSVISLIKNCKGLITIDSGIKYLGYTFNKPTLTFAQESKAPHTCPRYMQIRWLTFPYLIFPLEYSAKYIIYCMENLISNNNLMLCPDIGSDKLDQSLIIRNFIK
jgi:hypothetical protein